MKPGEMLTFTVEGTRALCRRVAQAIGRPEWQVGVAWSQGPNGLILASLQLFGDQGSLVSADGYSSAEVVVKLAFEAGQALVARGE